MRTLLQLSFYIFFLPYASNSQSNYNFYISNSGNDLNPGNSKLLPKRTIAGAEKIINDFGKLNGKVSVGLESASVFNESFAPSLALEVGSYYDSAKKSDFAVLNGSDVYDSGWVKLTGTLNTFQQAITTSGFTGNGGTGIGFYSFVYVIEIDKELEKSAPFTARKLLRFAPSLEALESIPGSFYETITDSRPTLLSIHTSDNSSPNSNLKYRYEVSVRGRAIDGYAIKNNRFSNLWVRGYGAGVGQIPSGANASYNKIIFGPGAAIHHVVLRSGTINNSLFLPAAKNIKNFAVVFYDVEGFGRHNKISNSIFLDIAIPIYTHTSNAGTNHGALELDNVIAFADVSEGGQFISMSNTDTLSLNKIYAEGYTFGYNYVSAKYVNIKNSCFKDVASGICFTTSDILPTIENVFIRSKEKINGTGISMQSLTSVNLLNSIIHIKSSTGTFVKGSGAPANHISAEGNIFISEANPDKYVTAATTNTDNGKGTSSDKWNNNVYVLLKGSKIVWTVTNSATNNGSNTIQTFDEWKRQSGQDKNSLFFDLRDDPRGLQAIFIDPENGNYELANTVEGNKIRDLQAGMTTPITCFLKKPTYEQAADLIRNDKVLSINSCRYRCQQTELNLGSPATLNSNGLVGICPNQYQLFKGSGNYKQNDQSYHQSDLTSRYLWWFSDDTDTSGVNLQSITHRFSDTSSAYIRLQVVDQNGCSFDSIFHGTFLPLPVTSLGNDTTLCKGFDVTLSARYPGADYLWSNGSRENSITARDKGIYWVQATLGGCSFRDSMELKLQNCPCNIQLPNAFTPNGDGLNDVYKPVFGCPPTIYELSVFDRNGQLVFKTNNYKNYWKGLYNGKSLPVGCYVYMLNIKNESLQKVKQLRGSIILLR